MDRHKSSGYYLLSDGVLTLVAGVILMFAFSVSQLLVTYIISAYAVVYGISQIVAARGEREPYENTGAFYGIGIFSLLAGIAFLFFRNSDLSLLIVMFAGYTIVLGIVEALTANWYSEIHGSAWLTSMGVLKAVFGITLLFFTGMSLSAFIVSLGFYAIIEGLLTIAYGYQLSQSKHVTPITHA